MFVAKGNASNLAYQERPEIDDIIRINETSSSCSE